MNEIRKISIRNKEYPKNLRYIADPPEELYVKGEILPEDEIAVALVGSRRASIYGLQTCEKLAFELASMGVTVLSGMARGIDSSAHKGALKAGGRTIAVFGCGINYIYPPENKSLAGQIEKRGALISEFPLDMPPFSGNFPKRNRIISGLSLGVVVVEASENSGALITANCALEQGREVFAVPGKVGSITSVGVHRLIKEGAKLVETVEDIIEELNLKPQVSGRPQLEPQPSVKLEEAESRIYSVLSDEPKHIDDIIEETRLLPGETSRLLLKLVLQKLIKELPGKLYYR